MSFRRNRALINERNLLLALILTAGIFFVPFEGYGADSSPFDRTTRILERWTASHWGQDCFVWVVHYPEELAAPWAEAEALRSGMSEAEEERFRKNFESDLGLKNSETFLVSVYSFGARPVNLSPVRDNVSLLTSTGERIKPTKYDSALDNPSLGVVQGLVFFPKQSKKDYAVALKGMSRVERIFSFSPPEPVPQPDDVVVVNLPKRQPKKPVPIPVKKTKPAPTPPPPPPPVIPPRPIKPIFQEESSDMADFVNSVRGRKAEPKPETVKPASKPLNNLENAYSSRESVIRRFLNFWADGSYGEMYEMLSEGSRKLISRENFAKQAARSSDIRAGVKSGDYRIDWVGEERAKVITTQKTLVFKSVATKTLGVTREGSSWRIVW